MTLLKMILVPDADGYQSTDGEDWLSTKLDGGRSRFRRDKLNAAKTVSVKWTLNPAQYQYWRSFFATVGSGAFLCDLLSEDGCGPVEQTCNIIPGTMGVPQQQGLTYIIQCQLEVVPIPHDPVLDASILTVFNASQGDPDAWLNALNHLVNVTAPLALHL